MGPTRPAPDEAARKFDELFQLHAGRVLAYALRRVRSDADAEDAVAETFTIAWRKIEHVPSDALPWLLSVARRVIANQRRSGRRRAILFGKLERQATPEPIPFAAIDPANGPAVGILHRLRPDDQEILALVAWEELDNRQIAHMLGITPNAVAIRLHRARKRFRHELMKDPEAIRTSTQTKGAINDAWQERVE